MRQLVLLVGALSWSNPAIGVAQDPTETSTVPAPSTPSRADIERALKRYAGEPSVGRVVRAALRALSSSPTGVSNMASRARSAGWVPRLGVTARRGQAVDLSSTDTTDDERIRLSTDDDLTLSASLTFELDRLVFRPEEVAIAREVRAQDDARATRVQQVVTLYFRRRRMQVERDLGLGDPVQTTLAIAEIEALLDAFTKGGFRRMMGHH